MDSRPTLGDSAVHTHPRGPPPPKTADPSLPTEDAAAPRGAAPRNMAMRISSGSSSLRGGCGGVAEVTGGAEQPAQASRGMDTAT
ncbi:hypothetical protein BS78_07G166200 [Paspalum vaginatum]|nr:hypothetical protein BS78_07G166200 [Paspalum vaginatum]